MITYWVAICFLPCIPGTLQPRTAASGAWKSLPGADLWTPASRADCATGTTGRAHQPLRTDGSVNADLSGKNTDKLADFTAYNFDTYRINVIQFAGVLYSFPLFFILYSLLRRRLLHARALLQRGCGVAACADRLGFANPFHFSRCYRRVFGHPPSADCPTRLASIAPCS